MNERSDTVRLRFEDIRRSGAEALRKVRAEAAEEELRRAARERVDALLGRDRRLDPRVRPPA